MHTWNLCSCHGRMLLLLLLQLNSHSHKGVTDSSSRITTCTRFRRENSKFRDGVPVPLKKYLLLPTSNRILFSQNKFIFQI
uniref:Secreted protein n=1 Tax=Oryza brachyantha TaxID=4533 RepID=J3MZ17_ORYBR